MINLSNFDNNIIYLYIYVTNQDTQVYRPAISADGFFLLKYHYSIQFNSFELVDGSRDLAIHI